MVGAGQILYIYIYITKTNFKLHKQKLMVRAGQQMSNKGHLKLVK